MLVCEVKINGQSYEMDLNKADDRNPDDYVELYKKQRNAKEDLFLGKFEHMDEAFSWLINNEVPR